VGVEPFFPELIEAPSALFTGSAFAQSQTSFRTSVTFG
jgi:hypothetical protein